MEQFSLDKWLKNKSRKVVTRRGNLVRIVCTDRKRGEYDLPIVFLEETNDGEVLLSCKSNGMHDNYESQQTQYDLFFADEEPETIEVPFGAKDSEFIKDEYLIPEDCEARIEGTKVIIEKKEEELTEFEKAVRNILVRYISNIDDFPETIKSEAKTLIDLARKEVLKELEHCVTIPEDDYYKELASQYQKGHEDALKSLPKWRKGNDGEFLYETSIVWTHDETKTLATAGLRLDSNTFYIPISELEKLPKEE